MQIKFDWITKRWALLAILGGCIILAIAIIKLQPSMQHAPEAGFITPVKVIDLKAYSVRPTIKGFGVVEPDILLEAKSEIAGKVVYVHPQLRDGAVIAENTVVIKIEIEDFQLSLQRAEADTAVSKANLREIKVKLKNTRTDLELANKKLALAKKDLERFKQLLKKHLVSQSNVDAQQSNVLKLRQEVQNLESLLRTLPEQRASLEADLANTKAAMQSQQRNLNRTTIKMPFNGRISKLAVEANQSVSQGGLLFSAQTIDKILINAQFPLQQFRILAKGFRGHEQQIKQAFQTGFSSELFTELGLSAKVHLADDFSPYWQAKVERISSNLDPATRTLGIVVSVDKPYEQIIPGVKPPLMEGMYTEIILQGKAKNFFVLPRDALHEGELFIVAADNRLERRTIKPTLLQGKMALFTTELQEGEKVIVSDLFPAVPGMTLKPVKDQGIEQQISTWSQEQ